MNKKEVRSFSNIFFLAIIAILIILSYLIIKPYLIPLISAFVLAYLTKPVYSKLVKTIGKSFSAIICILLVIIIIIIPIGIIIGGIVNQADRMLETGSLQSIINKVSEYPVIQDLGLDLSAIGEKSISIFISLFTSMTKYLPSLIISLIVVMFGIYYILTNWDFLASELKKYIPFKNKEKVSKELGKATNSIVYGAVLIALIEFAIAVAGFYLSGVSPYFLLPTLIFFLAFFPGLGPTIVWMPMSIYYFLTQNYFTAIGVLITGLILSFVIDAVLRSKIMGEKANINPLIMLVGILGGISVFGIFGFIIGPLILIYTLKLIQEQLKS